MLQPGPPRHRSLGIGWRYEITVAFVCHTRLEYGMSRTRRGNPMTQGTKNDPMFPVLNDEQVAYLRSVGPARRAHAGELLFDQGDSHHGVFIVVNGSIELLGISSGRETVLKVLGPGAFTGEVNQ